MAVFRGFSWSRVPGYIACQMVGAFLAAAVLYSMFGAAISEFEAANGILRGGAGSEASAKMFGEFYPADWTVQAFLAELIGTAVLALAIFTVTDPSNAAVPAKASPFCIGGTLTILISLLAPISQAGYNPARDLAPRIFSSLVGWGSHPFEVNGHGWLTVYIVAPILGALLGGAIARLAGRK